jgi:hypothetical protein
VPANCRSPRDDLVGSARGFAQQLPQSDPPPPEVAYADLVASGDEAVAQSNPAAAWVSYRQALAVNGNDPALWLKLADVANARGLAEARGRTTRSLRFRHRPPPTPPSRLSCSADGTDDRAAALCAMLARGLARREMWRESIATYRASSRWSTTRTGCRPARRGRGQHGFRITSNQVDSEVRRRRASAWCSPRRCRPAAPILSSYVTVEGAPQCRRRDRAEPDLRHRRRARPSLCVKVRSGLPSADGEAAAATMSNSMSMCPTARPFVGFANNAYVMPAGLGGGLPITSVNTEKADVVIYRIGDRSIATAVRNGVFRGTLDGYSAEDVANQLWRADLGRAARPVADQAQRDGGDRRAGRRRARPICSRAPMSSPPRSNEPSRSTGRKWPRSGSSSPTWG